VKVAVIGGGSAGLAAAWLLQDDHEVTLFEREDRLGGHAHTVEARHNGTAFPVESGFEFFAAESHPAFCRLLRAVKVPLREYPVTFTLYLEESGATHLMPPKRPDGVFWPAFAPGSLICLLQFAFFLRHGEQLVQASDTSVSIGDFVARFRFTRTFQDEFLYPFLVGGWCIPLADFRKLAAYNVLKYVILHRARGLEPRKFSEVPGGTAAYVVAIRQAMPRVAIRSGAPIRCIRKATSGYVLVDSAGESFACDHVVLATNAADARCLLHCVGEAEEERRLLGRFRYFETWIAVHGDQRFMPPNRKHWSVFNIRWRHDRSRSTVWKQQGTGAPVFKSWVDRDAPLPEPLYHLTPYYHPIVDVDYLQAQKSLAGVQGRLNLWFAGVYAHDIDSHESAIQSAIHVARQLAPESRNLARLLN
jgi:predicted NAD/FAD-binding protein